MDIYHYDVRLNVRLWSSNGQLEFKSGLKAAIAASLGQPVPEESGRAIPARPAPNEHAMRQRMIGQRMAGVRDTDIEEHMAHVRKGSLPANFRSTSGPLLVLFRSTSSLLLHGAKFR